MSKASNLLRSLPAEPQSLPPLLAGLSDAALVRAAARAIAQPKASRASSFILHAPMELLARAALLPVTPTVGRDAVRARIATIASVYAEGEEIRAPEKSFANEALALSALASSLRNADPDLADAAISFLDGRMSVQCLCAALADEIAPFLGAAAHVLILLAMLLEANPGYGDLLFLLRAPIRALATEGKMRLSWFDTADETVDGPHDLFAVLSAPPTVESPHIFVAPTMYSVEANGLASRLLTGATRGLSIVDARRSLLRTAALSMLQDDPEHAPYGWSHCLTMPQAALALASHAQNKCRAIRVAATYTLGFRATLGTVALDPTMAPNGKAPDMTTLAARAAVHPDAHLAKYTFACLKAAADDPPARNLFLAAANFLGEWWESHPDGGFDG
jgi:hypothetical protein